MSRSTRSSAPERALMAVAIAAACAAAPARVAAPERAPPLPAGVVALAPDLKAQGGGELTYFGISVYDGWYWSPVRGWPHGGRLCARPHLPPRSRRREDRASAASTKSRSSATGTDAERTRWGELMARLFPDVRRGDRLTGVYTGAGAVRYFHNGKSIGEIAEPGFARAFFGIWLDPKTSRADFRQKLLGHAMMAGAATGAAPGADAPRLSARALFAYGVLGMPLAMAALPLYVHLPKFYGEHLGVSLTALGLLLLALRLADGVLDPLLGAWSDRTPSRKRLIALAMPVLAAGMIALFAPPVRGETALLVWLSVALAVVYVAFSLATINHGAWGAELSSDAVERTRITAVRESLALGRRRHREPRARVARRRRRRHGRTAALRDRVRRVRLLAAPR